MKQAFIYNGMPERAKQEWVERRISNFNSVGSNISIGGRLTPLAPKKKDSDKMVAFKLKQRKELEEAHKACVIEEAKEIDKQREVMGVVFKKGEAVVVDDARNPDLYKRMMLFAKEEKENGFSLADASKVKEPKPEQEGKPPIAQKENPEQKGKGK